MAEEEIKGKEMGGWKVTVETEFFVDWTSLHKYGHYTATSEEFVPNRLGMRCLVTLLEQAIKDGEMKVSNFIERSEHIIVVNPDGVTRTYAEDFVKEE